MTVVANPQTAIRQIVFVRDVGEAVFTKPRPMRNWQSQGETAENQVDNNKILIIHEFIVNSSVPYEECLGTHNTIIKW